MSKLLPENHDSSTDTARPHWHQWGGDEPVRVTRDEVERSITEDHEAGERAIAEARLAAIQAILAGSDVSEVTSLARQVEVPGYVGLTLGGIDLSVEVETALLSTHLAAADRDLRNFIRGFVDGRSFRFGPEWVEAKFRDSRLPLTAIQRAEMLLSLPMNAHAIALARELGVVGEKHFWSQVNPYRVDAESRDEAARALVAHGFAFAAVELLGASRGEVPTNLVIEVMEGVLRSEPRPGDIGQMFSYHMHKFFERLADDPEVDPGRMAKLEWQFLALFDRREHRPRFLHRELAKNPDFFVEVLTLVFRGRDEAPRETSEEEQRRAHNAYTLLNTWRTPPGLHDDGSVDENVLREWVRTARAGCAAKDRKEVGDQTIGQMLSGAPADPDGTWPCKAVREVIEESSSSDLETGIAIGVYNSRGVWSKGIHEGGDQEEALAARYQAAADAAAAHYPRTAQMLRRMAADYRRDALRGDQDADRRQDNDE